MGFFSFLFSEWGIVFSLILYGLYKFSTIQHDFFLKKNVPYAKPLPFFGSMFSVFMQRKSVFDVVKELYLEFKDKKFFGIFEIRTPLLVINDPELLKQVTVKDFDHFVNHRSVLSPEDEPLFGNSLFVLKDQKWRDMRATLSPAFTGSKMRLMFELLEEVSKTAIEHLREEAKKSDPLDVDMKDLCTRFTNDVIASAAFGVKINSLKEKNNQFYVMGKRATNFSGLVSIKFFLYANFPSIMRFFKVRLFDQEFMNFFNHLVLDTMKYRTEHGIVRPDMINLLMEARKGALKHEAQVAKDEEGFATVEESSSEMKPTKRNWSDDEIVANCFLFFLAGFETASVLMCFCAHELMENPEIQAKLVEEIDEVNASLNRKPLNYDVLQKMKYMDMVMSETLRKWPPAIAADRVCVKPYTMVDSSTGQKVNINVGDILWIPTVGLHHNPEYYPNPQRFDPERFSDENKNNIKPFTYLPFGVGPRNCIGSRFALMESKVIIFHLLSKFTFEAASKTIVPLQLSPAGFQLQPKGGFWLRLKPRTVEN